MRTSDCACSSSSKSSTRPVEVFDWGRRTFNVPICIVTLVDVNRQWFKACYGLNVNQTGCDAAFCAHAIMPGTPDVC